WFVIRSWRERKDRPADLPGTLSGMVLESVVFALGLWAISRLLGPLLVRFGIAMTVASSERGMPQVVTDLGAGTNDEAIFRLVLFSLLAGSLAWFEVPRGLCVAFAAAGSAVLFSAAHHVGPNGQEYSNYVFLFRLIAGLYFSLLYEYRGFGIAVGTHACYNVMVSIPPN